MEQYPHPLFSVDPGFTSWDFLLLPLPSLYPSKESVRMYAFLPWLRNFLWKVGVGGGKGFFKKGIMFGCAGYLRCGT